MRKKKLALIKGSEQLKRKKGSAAHKDKTVRHTPSKARWEIVEPSAEWMHLLSWYKENRIHAVTSDIHVRDTVESPSNIYVLDNSCEWAPFVCRAQMPQKHLT